MADEDFGDASNNNGKSKNLTAISLKNDGNNYYKQGLYENALDYYNKALQIDPNNVDVLNNKGMALTKLGRNKEAAQCQNTIKKISLEYIQNQIISSRSLDQSTQYNPNSKMGSSDIWRMSHPSVPFFLVIFLLCLLLFFIGILGRINYDKIFFTGAWGIIILLGGISFLIAFGIQKSIDANLSRKANQTTIDIGNNFSNDPYQILKLRLANGEITEEEYKSRMRSLRDGDNF